MTTQPDISIITVNYNGFADTCELVESLRDHVTTPYELIAVDNGSRQDEAALLRERFPHIRTIRSQENLGFAGGNNLGIRIATGKYILLLNNDTVVRDDTLHLLAERLEQSPETGAVSPKIKFAFPPENIQFAGYTPLTRITMRNALVGFDRPDDGSYNQPARTPYAHGAAMMLKREVIEKAGEMPEVFFLYYEELDWCAQITRCGYDIWYEPRCTVYHKESRSAGRESPLRVRYITRNRLLYAWRNREGRDRLLAIAYQLLAAAPKNALAYLLRRQPRQALAVWQGCVGFIGLPGKTKLRNQTIQPR